MPQYHVTSPDGKTFEVNAPDGATEQDAIKYVMDNHPQANDAPPVVPGAGVATPQKDQSFLEKLQDPTTTAGALLKAPDLFFRGQSLGLTDYPIAAMHMLPGMGNTKTFEQNLQDVRHTNEAQRNASPVTSYGAEIAGGVTSPVYKAIGEGVTQGLTKAQQLANIAIPRYAGYGAQGVAAGMAGGAGNSQNAEGGVPSLGDLTKDTAKGGAIGGALGVAIPATMEVAAKAAGKASNLLATQAPKMTQDEFKFAAQAGYKAAEDAGVYIKPESFQKFVADLPNDLNGFHPKVTPGANNIIAALQDEAAKGPITLDTLDKLRSIASGASITRDPNEARLAGNIAAKIDDYVGGLQPENILLGEDKAKGAIDALTNARSLWRTYSKMKTISDIVDTGDALNDPNWVKGQFRAIVRKPAQFNRFTDAEKDAIKDVARTGILEKVLKLIPMRGLQMSSTYADPIMQGMKVNNLQSLIAGGGARPPTPGLSSKAALLASRFGAPVISPFKSGGSNQ